MMKVLQQTVVTIFISLATYGVVLGQAAPRAENKDRYSAAVITELRLTRHVLEQLKKDLKDLQVAAIRIRIQQEMIATKEQRLDSLKSQIQVTEDALDQIQDRVKKLEASDLSGSDDEEQQRVRAEIEDTKKEKEREQQKLDLLRSRDSELTGELQTDRARLSEMIGLLETLNFNQVSQNFDIQPKPGVPIGPPNN